MWIEESLVLTIHGEQLAEHGGAEGLRRTYVAAAAPAYAPMRPTCERLRADPSWRYLEIATGHDMMVSAPQALCRLLLDA